MPDAGADNRMSDLDALLWHLEAEPVMRSTVLVAAVLEGAPRHARLRDRVQRVSRLLPRLRQRVVSSPLGIATPRWELDPAFDIDYHLRVIGAPADRGPRDALLVLAEPLATDVLDPARPPWQMTLVDGLDGGRAGLLFRFHHAMSDGVGALALAAALLDLEPDADPPPLAARPEGVGSRELDRAWEDLDHEVRRGLALAARTLPRLARGLTEAVGAPEDTARGAVSRLRRLGHVSTPGIHPLSPVMTGRSLGARLEILPASLDGLRAAGASAGGTLNDAFLAATLGGLRRYHDKHGSWPDALRVGIPVNHRVANDAVLGNAFVPLRLRAGLQIADPAHRVAALHALVADARSEPVIELAMAAAGVAQRLPSVALNGILSPLLRATDIIASNVAGSPVPLYLVGSAVERLVAWGPRAGASVNFTMLSYRGQVQVGVNIDPAAVPDCDTLMACLRAGFNEVLDLA
jgi:diacylglycerol O-acyltransferase